MDSNEEIQVSGNSYDIHRPVLSFNEFENQYLRKDKAKKGKNFKLKHRVVNILKIYKLFTFFKVIIQYDFKKSLLKDIISGITVGIM
jgi:hypothetical protein